MNDDKFGLVLLDWNMPRLDGLAVARRIKMDPKLKEIKVLMVTAEAREANIKAAAQVGVDKFLVKPFTYSKFVEEVNRLLNISS